MNNELTTTESKGLNVFETTEGFEQAQRMAKALSASTMIPKSYQGNVQNTMVALEMAHRTGSSVLMVMQNLDIIQGKPAWASKYVIASLNACGRFAPMRFVYKELEEKTVEYIETTWVQGQKKPTKTKKSIKIQDVSCYAITVDKDGIKLTGQIVSIEMAVKEGWYTKEGSKWPTMTKQMLAYRAAKFFGNLYAPDVTMGMLSADEVADITHNSITPEQETQDINAEVVQESKGSDPMEEELL